jgi:hypothetical protein
MYLSYVMNHARGMSMTPAEWRKLSRNDKAFIIASVRYEADKMEEATKNN